MKQIEILAMYHLGMEYVPDNERNMEMHGAFELAIEALREKQERENPEALMIPLDEVIEVLEMIAQNDKTEYSYKGVKRLNALGEAPKDNWTRWNTPREIAQGAIKRWRAYAHKPKEVAHD